MKVLVLGKDGQVGRALARVFPEAIFLGRKDLDLSLPETIEFTLQELQPSCIINAAAYTAVDQAESEAELAFLVNETAVAELARYAAENNVWLIHFSTDYVFPGEQKHPYREDNATGPTGVYGRSKLAGEQAILKHCTRYYIFRTSWVFAEECANFVSTMLRLAGERDQLGVVNDQIGCPTYAGDIADIVSQVVNQKPIESGIYHLSCSGPVTWHDFAIEIFQRASTAGFISRIPKVKALTTAEYPTDAQRPANSVLDTDKLQQALGITMPHWSIGLQKMLDKHSGR